MLRCLRGRREPRRVSRESLRRAVEAIGNTHTSDDVGMPLALTDELYDDPKFYVGGDTSAEPDTDLSALTFGISIGVMAARLEDGHNFDSKEGLDV